MANKRPRKKAATVSFNCRIPIDLIREVDRAVAQRVQATGLPLSRNSFIIEALMEKLRHGS